MSDWLLRQIEIGSGVSSLCALCGLEQHAARRYLEGVANDGVNNIPLRQRLTRKGGYCGRHCKVFAGEAHLLSSAILFEDFLERRLGNALAGRTTRITCEACEAEKDMRRAVRTSLKRSRKDEALHEALEKTPLCLTHLELVCAALPKEARARLIDRHRDLRARLAEVVRKHDYRFSGSVTQEEARSVREALALFDPKARTG